MLAVVVIFLLGNDKKPQEIDVVVDEPPKEIPNLLNRLGLENDKSKVDKFFPKENAPQSPPVVPRKPEESKGQNKDQGFEEQDLSHDLEGIAQEEAFQNLQEKHGQLERKFKITEEDLQKKEKALNTELREKKEFNVVKDMLEKEIKDTKDEVHKSQLEASAAQAETNNYKKRTKATKKKK